MSLSPHVWDNHLSHIPCRKHRAGVDIHSCSQFLLELYSRWILPSSSARRTPVILISEVVRSVSLPSPPSLCAPSTIPGHARYTGFTPVDTHAEFMAPGNPGRKSWGFTHTR